MSAIADALDYAHERYLLHRDVKPANILLTEPRMGDRRILLADFGIAKAANETHGITATNMTVGSVAYAAPEQLTGKKLDGRADQYALACTAFHLLTGQQPFPHSNPAAVIGSHLSSPPPLLGSVRADLGSIENALAKAMSKEPFQRFDTCREFAAALSQGDAGWASSAAETQFAAIPAPVNAWAGSDQATTRTEPAADSPSRRVTLIAIGIAALLAVGIVAFIGARLGQPEPAPPPTAAPPQPSAPWPETVPTEPRRSVPPKTITETATVIPRPAPPPPVPRPAPPPPVPRPLPTPMISPLCNGQGIVVLGNVTTPGMYAEGVQRLLNEHPGASYLRTDQSCPSLRQADDEGDPIYTVYRLAGRTQGEVCAAVRAEGGDAYGKWMDYTTPPSYIIPC